MPYRLIWCEVTKIRPIVQDSAKQAKNLGWRLKLQSENPKRAGLASGARYGGHCGADTYEKLLRLGGN